MKDTYVFNPGELYTAEYLEDAKQELIGLKLNHKRFGECEIVDVRVVPYTPEGSIDKLAVCLNFPEGVKTYLASIFLKDCDPDDDSTNTVAMCDAMLYDLALQMKNLKMDNSIRILQEQLQAEKAAEEEKEKQEKEKRKSAKQTKKKKTKDEEDEEEE